MVRQLFSIGKKLKELGLEIKSFKKIFEGKIGEVKMMDGVITLKDGRTMTYTTEKSAEGLKQTFECGKIKLNAWTEQLTGGMESAEIGNAVIPGQRITYHVRNMGQIPEAGIFKQTPLSYGCKWKKEPTTGHLHEIVDGRVQEFHQDKYVNHFVLPTDQLLSTDGKLWPIYQRQVHGWQGKIHPMGELLRTYNGSLGV